MSNKLDKKELQQQNNVKYLNHLSKALSMTSSMMYSNSKLASLCTIVFISLLLIGCETISRKPTGNQATGQQLLDRAKNSPTKQQAELMLQAAQAFLQENQVERSLYVTAYINETLLEPSAQASLYLLRAKGLLQMNQAKQALENLQIVKLKHLTNLSRKQQLELFESLAQAYMKDGNHYQSALKRIELQDYLTSDTERSDNVLQIWLDLLAIPPEMLQHYLSGFPSEQVTPWLELAFLYQQHVQNPATLVDQLRGWILKYPDHSATNFLPTELKNALEAKPIQATQIALLLPSTGEYAQAAKVIRAGILAAHLNQPHASMPVIKNYDSNVAEAKQIIPLYQQAIEDGADFVIGPLAKNNVAELAKLSTFPVPTLSLNQLDENLYSSEFYQFGLPIEDVTEQVANYILHNQHYNGLLLLPMSNIGNRIKNTLAQYFNEENSAAILETSYYEPGRTDNLTKLIPDLLGVEQSHQRKQRIESILGKSLEFEPRRRQDVDFIFFHATPDEAKQIKPFIDYYYAHDVPVYTTASVYQGESNYQDLQGIIFADSPWLVSSEQSIQQQRKHLEKLMPYISGSSAPLFALGYDAYQIIPELHRLRAFSQYQLDGLSGKLSIDPAGVVRRQLLMAEFQKDHIQTLSTLPNKRVAANNDQP